MTTPTIAEVAAGLIVALHKAVRSAEQIGYARGLEDGRNLDPWEDVKRRFEVSDLTQRELAIRMGVTQARMSQLLDSKNPTLKTIIALRQHLTSLKDDKV